MELMRKQLSATGSAKALEAVTLVLMERWQRGRLEEVATPTLCWLEVRFLKVLGWGDESCGAGGVGSTLGCLRARSPSFAPQWGKAQRRELGTDAGAPGAAGQRG